MDGTSGDQGAVPKGIPGVPTNITSPAFQYEQFLRDNPSKLYDAVIDRVLVAETQQRVSEELQKGLMKGRHGWWNPAVCTLEYLKSMRYDALQREDEVSALALSAMIVQRERTA